MSSYVVLLLRLVGCFCLRYFCSYVSSYLVLLLRLVLSCFCFWVVVIVVAAAPAARS